YFYTCQKSELLLVGPLGFHYFFAVAAHHFHGVGASGAVYLYALGFGNKTKNIVARNSVAARRDGVIYLVYVFAYYKHIAVYAPNFLQLFLERFSRNLLRMLGISYNNLVPDLPDILRIYYAVSNAVIKLLHVIYTEMS